MPAGDRQDKARHAPAARPNDNPAPAQHAASLMHTIGEPRPRAAATRRRLRWLAGASAVALLIAPVVAWLNYQSTHVTSTNAAVRGHLAEVGTRLDGVVTALLVDAGDRVEEGEIIARLSDEGLQAEVEEARAELTGLQRELESEELAIRQARAEMAQQREEAAAEVGVAAARAEAARIRAEDAERSYRTLRDLHEQNGAISKQDVREAERDRRTAGAQLAESEAEHAAAKSAARKTDLAHEGLGIRERRIGVLEARIQRAEARLRRARAKLDSAIIRAPADGAVIRRIAQPGTAIEVGMPVVSMLLGDETWIEAWVDENDIADVHAGDTATVTLKSYPDREFSGTVERIGLATDFEMPESEVPQPRSSRMRQAPVIGVRIRLDETPDGLLPGMSAVVAIRRQSA